jgi:hypothetical protein
MDQHFVLECGAGVKSIRSTAWLDAFTFCTAFAEIRRPAGWLEGWPVMELQTKEI